jgi:hypothetical protein
VETGLQSMSAGQERFAKQIEREKKLVFTAMPASESLLRTRRVRAFTAWQSGTTLPCIVLIVQSRSGN